MPLAGLVGDCGAAGSVVDGVDDGADDGAAVDGVDDGVAAVDDSLDDGFDVVDGVVAGASVDEGLGACDVVGALLLVFVGGGVVGLLQPAASAHAAISIT